MATDSTEESEGAEKALPEGRGRLAQVMARLEERARAARTRVEENESAEATIGTAVVVAGDGDEQLKRNRGRASAAVIEEAQLSLFQLEREGQFTKQPLAPQSEFPTFLTRIPIFVPARRGTQRQLLDEDNALPFATSWGQGRKHGPPLTIYDEDTLIAIGRLRQNLLVGRPRNMPVPVSEVYSRNRDENVRVHVLYCMLSDIQNVCGTSQGGKNNQLRLDSIKRLAATRIEFDTKASDKFVSAGTTVSLIDVAWQEYAENAILYIQFSPVMAAWYEQAYTYIDWNVRRKLTDPGKAIHRFLAGQPKSYEIYAKKLKETIGYPRSYNKFMADLREGLRRLEGEGWLTSWVIEGNGRSHPHKLVIRRR